MSPIQILLTVFLGAAAVRALLAIRAQQTSWRRGVLWLVLWGGGIAAVWFPDITTRFAHDVGVGRGVDAVVYLTVAVLSYLVFRLYAALEKQDQVITRLVSELALREGDTDLPPRGVEPGHMGGRSD